MPTNDETRARSERSVATRLRQIVPAAVWAVPIKAGVGAFITILFLAEMSWHLGTTLLIAPFGASCVLVFAVPQSPFAQPRNVIGGHLISATIGLLVFHTLGATPFAYALLV
jgi:CBS-domain-containing membrane protein